MEFDVALHGKHAGDVFLDGADTHGVIELVDGLLEAQLEEARHIKPDAQDEPFAVSLPSPMTEEEIQQFEKMISSIEHTTLYDETVLNIIRSEAAAFLAGQRSAEETARLVQSRVSLYVSEQHN